MQTIRMASKRKLWQEESMKEAVAFVQSGSSLRQAAKLYNVPVETLRRRFNGTVTLDCKPGPSTVLTADEEQCLAHYVIEMADRGFGLVSEDLMRTAFTIAERSGRSHPFRNGMAGRGWLEAFRRRHPEITLRTPQALSYSRAASASKAVVDDFFAKLGALYGRLNLINKPMQVYNIDETGISVVHKPGKVFSAVGRKHVYSIASGEKGKTHTVVVCVSASGNAIPPLMIYPRKRAVPESMRNGAVPGTKFMTSDSGWITQELYLEWLKFFIASIPPARPVLLIEDGHGSHVTLDVIELARANDVHLLCLPSHTSHILQPLDIGVFKSFKASYAKACRKYMMDNPGRVITSEVIASLVGKTWVESVTPVNILSGFKKSGIFPLNPSEVSDRMLAPSVNFNPSTSDSASSSASPTFTADQVHLYEQRFSEGYDLHDPQYELWVKENHPSSSDTDSLKTHVSSKSISTVSSNLSDILKYPEPKAPSKTKKQGMNTCSAACLSDSPMVQQLKENEERKRQLDIEKQRKKDEKEEKKAERERRKLLKEKQKEERMKEREAKRKQKEQRSAKKTSSRHAKTTRNSVLNEEEGGVSDEEGGGVSNEERDGEEDCPVCHIKGLCCQWICCDSCDTWLHTHCTEVDPEQLPDIYYCFRCV